MPSLSALRSRVAALPGTARLVEALAVPSAEVVAAAPAGARPILVSALAPTRTGAPVLAVTATGREAEDLHAALQSQPGRRGRRAVPLLGDPPARAAQPAQRHGRPAPVGAAPAGPPRDRRRHPRGAVGRRRAGASGAPADLQGPGRPQARRAAGRRRRAARAGRRGPGSRRLRAAPTSSSAAASSRCAAASSTSSRPPRSTRCAWSSGATPSRRSAGSRSPTSVRSRWPSTACGRRRAASCC